MSNRNYRKEFFNRIEGLEMDDRVESFCYNILDEIDDLEGLIEVKDSEIDDLRDKIADLEDEVFELQQRRL